MNSLQARLLLAVGALALAAIGLVAVAVRQGTHVEFRRFAEVERRGQTARLPQAAQRLALALDTRCCSESDALGAAASGLPQDTALIVLDAASGTLVSARGAALTDGTNVVAARQGEVLVVEWSRRIGARLEQAELRFRQSPSPLRLIDGRPALLYVVPVPTEEQARTQAAFFSALDRRLIVAAASVGLLAVLATWAVVRGVTRPVAELQRATRDLAAGNLTRRVIPGGSRETIELGQAFNAMAADLQRQEALRRDLVHDVAHELRTPLTDLRCRLEAVIDGLAPNPAQTVRDLHEDVRHLGRLVDDLQDLAQAEARTLHLDVRAVGLADVIHVALRAAGLDGDARVTVAVPPDLAVRADRDRLRQIVVNLLTNAARHTPEGEAIAIEAASAGDVARVQVRNSGIHLDAATVVRLFERFYRADPARGRVTGGSGLGLAIVKHLVEAHGGTAWAVSDAASVTVGFALPLAKAQTGAGPHSVSTG